MLVVLASYPKSGNTWLRRFVSCYALQRLVSINDMGALVTSEAAYSLWESVMQMDHTVKMDDYYAARVDFFKRLSEKTGDKRMWLKSHSAHLNYGNHPVFCDSCIDKFVHVVRNPLDVLPSFAHHLGIDVYQTWKKMVDEKLFLAGGTKEDLRFYELLSSWQVHTESWLKMSEAYPDRFLSIRYEDMKLKPITTFIKVIHHLGLPYDENLLINALNWSSFDLMKKEESSSENGFIEAAAPGRVFFRKGQIGSGREEVPKIIQEEMFAKWKNIIEKLGYEALFNA